MTVPTRVEIAEQYNELHKMGFNLKLYDKQQAKIVKSTFYLLTERKNQKDGVSNRHSV